MKGVLIDNSLCLLVLYSSQQTRITQNLMQDMYKCIAFKHP